MVFSRFDELIRANGLSNIDVARKLGVSDVLVGAWRKGKYDPSSENLKKIADLFHVSADYLLGDSDSPTSESGDAHIEILARAARRMTVEEKQKLIEMAKVMFKDAFDESK